MDILKTFGIDIYLTIAQIVNFLIILFILKKYLYKPLFKMLKKRQDLAKEVVENAESSRKELDKARAEEKKIIKKAQEAAAQIVSDTKEQADEIIKQSEVNARQQTERMIEEARNQIAQETANAQQQLNRYVSKLSVDILRKSLQNVFGDKEQDVLIEKALKEMQKKPN
jgi:F-type H+-transporting ATPase subunit b